MHNYIWLGTANSLPVLQDIIKIDQKQMKQELEQRSQGRPQDLAGGGKNFFSRFGNLHVAKQHAAHGEAMRFARGFGGMPPPRNFF